MASNKDDISKELDDLNVDAGTDDDYFEKVLAGEGLQEPTDDDNDAGAETSDKKVETEVPKVIPDEVETLKAEIARLQKEAKGRLSDVVQSRQEKAQFKAELNELRSAVAELLEKRDNALKEPEPKKVPLQETKRSIEFDADDNAFVDLSDVKEAIKAETDLTKKELEELKAERELEKMKAEYNRNISAIINEDKAIFEPAYNNLRDIFKDLNDSIIELQLRTGEMGDGGVLSQEDALELFDGSPEEKAFLERHPGIDPTRVARAFNTKLDLRRSLRHIVEANKIGLKAEEPAKPTLDDKIKAAKSKPGSLAKTENQAAGNVNLIDRIASLSFQDLESLTDAEAAKIEAMLLKEELKGD